MSYWKSFGLVLFAVVCLLDEAAGSAHAQIATEWSDGTVIKLGNLGGNTGSEAFAINNAGQAVGHSGPYAVEWSGGSVIQLGAGIAEDINDAGQAVGVGSFGNGHATAVEWSGGGAIQLPNLPGTKYSFAYGINDAGQIVGLSEVGNTLTFYATEWSDGSVISLGALPGQGDTLKLANGINDAGHVVGVNFPYAVEWNGGSVITLGLGQANRINDAGQVVGQAVGGATEWSNGNVINALDINDAGRVVGYSGAGNTFFATEWSGVIGGSIINLGGLPGFDSSLAQGINDAGQVVGYSQFAPPPVVPEPSTWAMMLAGFAGLTFAGYRRAKPGRAILAG
jgi:probable HAF family extracellular repeat protein